MGKVVWDWEKNAETGMGLLLRIRGYLCEEEEKELTVGKGKWVGIGNGDSNFFKTCS
jgi:hypothetical protein